MTSRILVLHDFKILNNYTFSKQQSALVYQCVDEEFTPNLARDEVHLLTQNCSYTYILP